MAKRRHTPEQVINKLREAEVAIAEGSGSGPIPPNEPDRLTAREREILKMFACGMSYAQIAEARGNSNPMSVRNAIYAIRRKLGLGTRQEMGVWAARSGLLDDDELL